MSPGVGLLLLISCAGCTSAMGVELRSELTKTVLSRARAAQRVTATPVKLEIAPGVQLLGAECLFEDRLHRYRVAVGPALSDSIRELLGIMWQGPAEASDPITVSLERLEAESVLNRREAKATLRLNVTALQRGKVLVQAQLVGAGAAKMSSEWTFTIDNRIATAFNIALAVVQLRFVEFVSGLELAPPSVVEVRPEQIEAPPPTAGSSDGDLKRAEMLIFLGDPAGARDVLTRLIRSKPGFALAFQRRSAVLLGMGNVDAALADSYRAIELDPKLAIAFVTRAQAFARKGDASAVKRDCAMALSLTKDETVKVQVARLLEQVPLD